MFEAAVDRFGGPVGGAGAVEVGQHVGGTLLQAAGSPSFSTGQPVSAVAAALIAALVGKYLTGKTPLDMVLVPFGATTAGTISGLGLAAVTTPLLLDISRFIEQSMHVNPVLGSVCVSLAWALFLMSPASRLNCWLFCFSG